jgi:hypothetical protein
MKLTQEEKRIKLSEVCSFVHNMDRSFVWFSIDRWVEFDPFNDLNAAHELEKVLRGTEEQHHNDPMVNRRWKMYQYHLMQKFGASATAAERAEALGKTLNLW